MPAQLGWCSFWDPAQPPIPVKKFSDLQSSFQPWSFANGHHIQEVFFQPGVHFTALLCCKSCLVQSWLHIFYFFIDKAFHSSNIYIMIFLLFYLQPRALFLHSICKALTSRALHRKDPSWSICLLGAVLLHWSLMGPLWVTSSGDYQRALDCSI